MVSIARLFPLKKDLFMITSVFPKMAADCGIIILHSWKQKLWWNFKMASIGMAMIINWNQKW